MSRLIPLSILLSFHALVLTGCVSQIASVKDAGQAYIGHSIKELEETMARPGAYPPARKWIAVTQLPDGKSLYVGAVREDCNIHWTVNQEGTIESFKTEGERCY